MNGSTSKILVLGQGLAGSVLALRLAGMGLPFDLLTDPGQPRASEKAAGLVNPVTGKRMALTWGYDFLFPEAKSFYSRAYSLIFPDSPPGSFLKARRLVKALHQVEELNFISGKSAERGYENLLIPHPATAPFPKLFQHLAGWCETRDGFRMDVPFFLESVRNYLKARGQYQEGTFDRSHLIYRDGTGWEWKGEVYAAVVSALGLGCPWIGKHLWPSKGQVYELAGWPDWGTDVLKTEHFFIPTEKGTVLAGSTYERGATHPDPDPAGLEVILSSLDPSWKSTARVVGAWAGFRPTTPNRRPLLENPEPGIYCINGLGSKGVSLAPWLSKQLIIRFLQKTEGETSPEE